MENVGTMMTRRDRLATLTPETTAKEAIHVLLQRQVSGASVINGKNELVGIISEFQLLGAVYDEQFCNRAVLLTAFQSGGAGRSNLVALGVDSLRMDRSCCGFSV